MKTTIDIPEAVLDEAMRHSKSSTKRDAVLAALEDFNRRKRLESLSATFGSWNIAGNDEIEAGDALEMSKARRL